MRKLFYLLYALSLALLFAAAVLVYPGLPVDNGDYVAGKYDGWNGVLQAWICCEWQPGGSFISWLNSCSADFEAAHDGVYLEFTPVSRQTVASMEDSGIQKPDLLFFSPGVPDSGDGMMALRSPRLRNDLAMEPALPVAMGGYMWVYNPALTDGAPANPGEALPLTLMPDGGGRCFSAGTIALLSGAGGVEQEPAPESGLDLGLPASAGGEVRSCGDALDAFLRGEAAHLPVTQRELMQLNRMREAGRGPDWRCAATGDFAWADQLLLAAAIEQTGESAEARQALAAEFILDLLEPEAQGKLKDIGAFAVTGEAVHSPFSVYAGMEQMINSRRLLAPDPFSECCAAGGAAIVREYCRGGISLREALAALGHGDALQKRLN